jgi:hypothetical protein
MDYWGGVIGKGVGGRSLWGGGRGFSLFFILIKHLFITGFFSPFIHLVGFSAFSNLICLIVQSLYTYPLPYNLLC